MRCRTYFIITLFLFITPLMVSAGPFTSQLNDTEDTFTGTTINGSLWNQSVSSGGNLYQNNQIFLEMIASKDEEEGVALYINSSYINFSEQFNATIEVEINSISMNATNMSQFFLGIIKDDPNSEDSELYTCAASYLNDSTNDATTKLFFTDPSYNGNDSTISIENYLDANITLSYDQTTGIFSCELETSEGVNTTTHKYSGDHSVLDDWTNMSLYIGSGISDGGGENGAGVHNFSGDNFNFTTQADDEEEEEESGAVPEWDDYAILLILVTVIGGFLVIKNKEE